MRLAYYLWEASARVLIAEPRNRKPRDAPEAHWCEVRFYLHDKKEKPYG